MQPIYRIVEADQAKDEPAAQVEITPQFRLSALDALAPEDGSAGLPGHYDVVSPPRETQADDSAATEHAADGDGASA